MSFRIEIFQLRTNVLHRTVLTSHNKVFNRQRHDNETRILRKLLSAHELRIADEDGNLIV